MLKQFLIDNPMISYAVIGTGIVIAGIVTSKAMQTIGLEKIRKTVYHAFVHAEHSFFHGDNDNKFEYVVDVAKKALPAPFSFFITETLLRDVVQLWFDLCKDLLDDGKLNNSEPKEAEADTTKEEVM